MRGVFDSSASVVGDAVMEGVSQKQYWLWWWLPDTHHKRMAEGSWNLLEGEGNGPRSNCGSSSGILRGKSEENKCKEGGIPESEHDE